MTDLIENYEDKTPSELENEISDADFSESELEELREHEAENEERGMVLDTINAELAAFETEQAGATDFVTEEVETEDDDVDETADDPEAVEADEVDVSDAETEVEHGEPMDTDDEDDEPEYVDIKSDGHHYAGGHFFDEITGEKKEGVRYNARVKDAEEKGRLKVLK